MKKILPVLILSIYNLFVFSQTVVPFGTVSGTWTTAGSPYLVQGNILIANGTSLTINPGVTVNFQGSYSLSVSGRLLAQGAATDSIQFSANDTTTGWQGIRFDNTPASNDSSRIAYCSIKYGYLKNSPNRHGGGIYIRSFSKISILNSSIYNCAVQPGGFGSGIYAESSDVVIAGNNISYNHSNEGAVYIKNGSPVVKNNLISHNDYTMPWNDPGDPGIDPDSYGGGLVIEGSSASVIGNTIIYNFTWSKGGGIVSTSSKNANIQNNVISYNKSGNLGGGVYCVGGLNLIDNIINSNLAEVSGGGVCVIGELPDNHVISSNRILNNKAGISGAGMFLSFPFNTPVPAVTKNNLIAENEVFSPTASYYIGGAGIFIWNGSASSVFTNNVIVNNSAPASNGGGIMCYNGNPALENNTLSNNKALNGGALYCTGSKPVLKNAIIWGNTATVDGAQIYLFDSVLSIPTIIYSDIQGGVNGIRPYAAFTGIYQNNIDSNPNFIAPSAGSGIGFNGQLANWSLQDSSPAINKGKPNDVYPAIDYAGNNRVVNGIIDIGALENQTNFPPLINIISPVAPANFTTNSTIQVKINAIDLGGSISKVDIFVNGILFGTDSIAPYTFTGANVAAGVYNVTAKATDNFGATAETDTLVVTVADCTGSGSISGEGFTNINGAAVVNLTSDPKFINNLPDITAALGSFEYQNVADNYGARVRGYICAPLSGNYRFWVSSDEQATLYLSTDASEANIVPIAYTLAPTGFRQYAKYSSQISALIPLVKGAKYFIQTLHKEAGGADHLTVSWQLPNGTFEGPIPGSRLSPYASTPAPLAARVVGARNFAAAMGSISVVKDFSVTATPNPSANYFTLSIKSNLDKAVSVKIMDAAGRLVETKLNAAANSTMHIGEKLVPGVYFVEVLQGNKVQRIKLVKQ